MGRGGEAEVVSDEIGLPSELGHINLMPSKSEQERTQ